MSKHYIIPIFVPHFGCPHDCVFCNQKKITGLSTNVKPDEVEEIILQHLEYFQKDAFIEIAFYGGSFTAIDIDTQSMLLEVPYKYKNKGIINEIRLSTRPDAISKRILVNLKKFGVDTIELGVQSMDEAVLYASERGHTTRDVYEASSLIREFDFKLGLQMMLGLPEDNLERSINTCLEFIKLNPDCVRIYPTLVIKDTYLEKQFIEGIYKPLSLDEAVDQSTLLLMLFYLKNINVIRVGLQPTDNIQLGKDVVVGPFHPAFRQLVESNIYKVLLDYYFSDKEIIKDKQEFILEVNERKISLLAGQKSNNIKYWLEKYGFSKVRIYQKDVVANNLCITIGNYYDKININGLMERYVLDYPLIKK